MDAPGRRQAAVAAARRRALQSLGSTIDDPVFSYVGWDVEGDTVRLRYAIDGLGELTEQVTFPGFDLAVAAQRPATAGALDVLHLTAATSYYKAVLPRRVNLGAVRPAARAMTEALLTDGLAEFAYRNNLDVRDYPQLHSTPATPTTPAATAPPDGVLVPVGGGKDSAVTATLAVRAGWDAVAFAVNPKPSMRRTADAVGISLLTAQRRLDPRLFAFNDRGALNGHIPITAIVASIACVAATLTGRGDALLSNEASADEPTRVVDGHAINHQYSKSSTFEALHRAAMAEATGGATRALSVLRPLPELIVAATFAHLRAPLAAVNSCNRAYVLSNDGREWCGECPKCLFSQLMLAPFTTPEAFIDATGFDALARPDLVDAFGDLTDPVRKPFECVGTVEEVQVALDLLADHPDWRGHAAVTAHGHADAGAQERLRAMAGAVDLDALPARYAGALRGVVSELAA